MAKHPPFLLGRYPQTERRFFYTEDGLPSNRIAALAITPDGTVYAGTDVGVARWDGNRWEVLAARAGLPEAPVQVMHTDTQGRVWAGFADALYALVGGTWQKRLDSGITAMAEDGRGRIFVVKPGEVVTLTPSGEWTDVAPTRYFEVRDIAAYGNGQLLLATRQGLQTLFGKERDWSHGRTQGPSRDGWNTIRADKSGLPTNDLYCIDADKWGHIWVGSPMGVTIHDDRSYWHHIDGTKGLPYEDVRLIVTGPAGERWFGTPKGALRLQDGAWKFFGYKRWLPHESVHAIALHPDGSVWIGTEEGISRLSVRHMTLAEKAAHYDELVQKYHKRHEYTTSRNLAREGDLNSGRVSISDNDGLWTATYVAAQSYRYAVTGEEDAREKARNAVQAVMKLVEMSGIPGFPARAIRHKSEPEFGQPHSEWHLTADGEWEWKSDTSSDELVGHYYAYALYHDLVANDEEKEQIRQTVAAVTDHIVDNGYFLIDHDGRPTTWAVWSPEKLNRENRWWAEKGCNSLQILAFLKTALHITGNEKYQKAYEELVRQHHYAMNTIEQKLAEPIGRVNHIDDKLAMFPMVLLLTYEQDPNLRAMYMMGLKHHWEFERPERTPLWNIIYGGLTGRFWDAEPAVQSLAELPLDIVVWEMRNSHRADLVWDEEVEREYGRKQLAVPLPVDEQPLRRSGAQPYMADGGNGRSTVDPTMGFLQPYWMARYWGLIDETQ